MVDNLALFVPHVLLLIAVWRLAHRPDLDRDPPEDESGGEASRG